jgi:uncharacterized protein (TIGR02246 family)
MPIPPRPRRRRTRTLPPARFLLVALAAFVVVVAPPPAARAADATADAKKAIQAAYNKMNAALERKDVNGAFSVLTPDAEQITLQGQRLSAAQMRQQMTQGLAQARSIRSRTTVQKVTLKGNQALAVVRSQVSFVVTDPQSGRDAKIAADEVSDDTWIKTAQGWRAKRSKTTRQKQTVNGQPVPPGA